MNNSQTLEIKFGGVLHEIDADVFIESLINYSAVTQEVSAYLSPNSKINIKIKAPKEGSFIILLNLFAEEMKTVFDADNLNYAETVIAIVAGLYAFKQWILKKGKVETIKHINENNVEISNNNSTIIIDKRVFNIYQDSPRVRENIRKTFSKLKENDDITDFSIITDNTEIFKVEKEDFAQMSSDKDELEKKRQIEIKENQELSVFKIIFSENYKWEFFYQGNKIYAFMQDKEFFESIHKGRIAFRSGDRMIVNLKIEKIFNETANIFVNESYSIIKVIEHIPREPHLLQLTLLDIDDISKD